MTRPHSVIFCDIDGCLNKGKHVGFDLRELEHIRNQIKTLSTIGITFCLCTGRPQPYAEAMAQILDLQTPFVCEHGALVFDPGTEQGYSMLSSHEQQEIAKLRQHLQTIVGVENTHTFEPGNEYNLCITGPGIIGRSNDGIRMIKDQYQAKCSGFDVIWASSDSAIDISAKTIGKQTGAAWIAEHLQISKNDTYAIGDSTGDLGLLSFVNHTLCPANAAKEVKDICETVAPSAYTTGVSELLDIVLSRRGIGI